MPNTETIFVPHLGGFTPAWELGPAVPTVFDACRAAGRSSAVVVGDQCLIGVMGAYQTAGPIDTSKPTLVLVNSFTTSAELYRDMYANRSLTAAMNLVAIELLGHGQTRAHTAPHWTYWDTAAMNLQVMEALGVDKAFVLGTSQGGWVTVRMALLAPEKVFVSAFPGFV